LLIVGLIGLSAGAGFNGLLILIGIITMLLHPAASAFDNNIKMFAFLGMGLAITSIVIFCWLRMWRKIRNLSRTARIWLALACWALPLVNVIAMMVLVMP
jgi:hypothetical protein